MDARRSRYLQAMGIQAWVPRSSLTAEAVQPLPVTPVEQQALVETATVNESLHNQPIPPEAVSTEVGIQANEAATINALDLSSLGWEELQQQVAQCHLCELAQTRRQTVFGVGNRQAELLVIGEAPGADEDAQGEPFVGRAGQLLNGMLKSIGLTRESVYIANILKCRPPNNRDPQAEEVTRCEPYLQRQIELIQPRVILAVGRIAVHQLLKVDTPLGQLRGQELAYGPQNIPLIATYHPAYLLRTPADKAKAWEDLLRIRAMGIGA